MGVSFWTDFTCDEPGCHSKLAVKMYGGRVPPRESGWQSISISTATDGCREHTEEHILCEKHAMRIDRFSPSQEGLSQAGRDSHGSR